MSRTSLTHSVFIGLAPGPVSPPKITQLIPVMADKESALLNVGYNKSTGPNIGSILTHRTAAGI